MKKNQTIETMLQVKGNESERGSYYVFKNNEKALLRHYGTLTVVYNKAEDEITVTGNGWSRSDYDSINTFMNFYGFAPLSKVAQVQEKATFKR